MAESPKPAENGTEDDSNGNEPQKEPEPSDVHNFAVVCRLLCEGAPEVMRDTFNRIYPPINLQESLSVPATFRTLRRLKSYGVLTGENWDLLFPGDKRVPKSKTFDSTLLGVLLRHVCHLTPPYPNGWENWPIKEDASLSADLGRLSCYRQQLAASCGSGDTEFSTDDFQVHFEAIAGVFKRLHPQVRMNIQRMQEETLDSAAQGRYFQAVVDWQHKAYGASASEARLTKQQPEHREPELTRSGTMGADYGGDTTDGQTDSKINRQLSRSISKRMAKDGQNLSKEEMTKFERSLLLQYQKKICDTVYSDDIIGRLVQRSMLTHENKNKISLATKNSERMKIVLEMLSKKPGNTFDIFCDIIKFKYKALYDLLTQAKKAPFQHEKPDEVLECSNALKQQYLAMYSEYTPIPWHRMAHAPFQDCYITPYITDYQGRRLAPQDIFDPHPKSTNPRRLLITGQSGAGKSTLCRHLVNEWSQARDSPMHRRFKLVFLLDLRRVTSDLVDSVISQCLPLSYRRSRKEVADLLEKNQKSVLFILDGMEELPPSKDADIMSLIYKDLYRNCGVILTDNNHPSQSLSKYFDTKLIVMGLERQQPDDLVKVYSHLTKVPRETFAALTDKLTSENETTLSVLGRNPLYCLCMCLIAEMEESLDFETVSHLLQNFTQAAQKLNCLQNNIKMPEGRVPDIAADIIRKIEEFAFVTLVEHRLTFPTQEIAALNPRTDDDLFNIVDIYQAGTSSRPVYVSYFCNKVIHEFLAACYVCNMEPREREKHVGVLLAEPHMTNAAVFYCGLPKAPPTPDEEDDDDADAGKEKEPEDICPMKDFYAEVAQLNRGLRRGVTIKTGSGDDESRSRSRSEGRISDLKFSMDCVEECEGDAEALDIITSSLPECMKMKKRDVISACTLRGLACLLASSTCPVTELDLMLDHFTDYEEHGMLRLASSINGSQQVTSLKLHWTKEEVLALFLAKIFGKNRSIRSIQIWDETHRAATNVSAIAWSNLRSACINMQSVREFTFLDCKNPAVVTSAIRNSPITLEELNLAGCTLDLISSQELGNKIEKSRTLHLLDLTGAQLKRPDFVYIASGIRLTKSLQELILAETDFDRGSIEALADALIFNNSLRRLDLSRAELSDESVDIIAQALGTNQWLQQVMFTGSQMSEDAVKMLRSYKRKGLRMTGLVGRRYISPSERFSRENTQLSLPISAAT